MKTYHQRRALQDFAIKYYKQDEPVDHALSIWTAVWFVLVAAALVGLLFGHG